MTTIEDLPQKSISEMTTEEAIEKLRQIRLSRRTQKATTKKPSTTKTKAKKVPEKELSPSQARILLKLLTGE